MKVNFIPRFFFALVFLSGCSTGTKPDSTSSDSGSIDSAMILLVNDQPEPVESSIDFRMIIPEGFSLDTTEYFDAAYNAQIDILVPISGDEMLDNTIRQKQKNESESFLVPLIPPPTPAM